MDNSGNGTLKVPGFGGIPIFHQLKNDSVFTHGAGGTEAYNPSDYEEQSPFSSWEQLPRLTAREISMIGLMNTITDKKDWNIDVLNQDVADKWRREFSQVGLISEKAWMWCLAELTDKAQSLNNLQRKHVVVLDTGSCVCKSDTLIAAEVQDELQQYSESLRQEVTTKQAHDQLLIDPSLYPLVLGKTSVLTEGGQVNLKNFLDYYGQGVTSSCNPPHPLIDDPRQRRDTMKFPFTSFESELNMYRFSTAYQWLPCEIEFKDIAGSGTGVDITSNINNLHPRNRGLYRTLEILIAQSIKPWNDCLIYAQRPRVSPRIRTYGIDYWSYEHPEPGISFTYKEWKQGKVASAIIPPTPRFLEFCPLQGQNHEFYDIALEQTFREQGLQIVVQMSDIELTPDQPSYPGNDWHISGLLNDHVVATSVYFYDVDNISEAKISFRQQTWFENTECIWKDLKHLEFVADVFGVDVTGLSDDQIPLCDTHAEGTQKLGSIVTPQGRLLVWANALQHQVEPFQLQDTTRKGHQRSVILHLVDPHYRLCSTRNVPPQRHDWWAKAVTACLLKLRCPPEIVKIILSYTYTWPVGLQDALGLKKELEKEHYWAMEALKELEGSYWGLNLTGRLDPWRQCS